MNRIKKRRKDSRLPLKPIFLALMLFIVILAAYLAHTLYQPEKHLTSSQFSTLKAVIVDQLSLTLPNQTFKETATNILEEAGYKVDYYENEQITVDFYRDLPTHGYKLILLRVHSAGSSTSGEVELQLFTSEVYSNRKYVSEQLSDQVGMVTYSAFSGLPYFGICPNFVRHCMVDEFRGSVVVAMGCEGLLGMQMASAFIHKGAKAYIGWNSSVQASHTDQATTSLLQHLIVERETIRLAVQNTMEEVGLDPIYSSLLTYYPIDAGEQKIEDS